MSTDAAPTLDDTGERMIPPTGGEVSLVWARHRVAYALAAEMATKHAAAMGAAANRPLRILDVGTGTGYGARMLADAVAPAGGTVTALDAAADAVDYARAHYAAANMTVEVGTDATLDAPEHAGAYDLVASFQVIEHAHDAPRFLARLLAATRPGGAVLVTTPNLRRRLPAAEANPFHHSEMTHAEFAAMLAASGVRFDLWGVGYAGRPAWQRWLSSTALYRWGRRLGRGSALKRVGVRRARPRHARRAPAACRRRRRRPPRRLPRLTVVPSLTISQPHHPPCPSSTPTTAPGAAGKST